ncbi:MAG: exo-beta-N-acetylmuramidase NamZ family protein [Gemmatimonadales bacterium]
MHRSLVGLLGWSLGLALACAPAGPAAGPAAGARVRPGIDVLVTDSLALVRGRRVGLVTNQAGVDAQGNGDVARLQAAGVQLVALFSPEHGFRGAADPGAAVASSIDSATGLPIYSLYGRTTAPTDEMLAGVDVLLVDLQDAGARYYTYLFTTIEIMRAAAHRGVAVVVLDRPDPIGGAVQGNVLDTAFRTPVGQLAVPMRYGMTLGELARLARADLGLTTDLRIVPVAGWRRDESLDATGLPFVPPSPNLRRLDALYHYPGLCLFEGTNLSVGRGSDTPFEQIGAPWLDTSAVLARVRAAGLPGVRFAAVRFTPRSPGDGKYADTAVSGIRLELTDRRRYDPTVTAVTLLAAVRAVSPAAFQWIPAHFDRLAGGPRLRDQLEHGAPASAIVAQWTADLRRFRERRRPFLVYPE